MVDTKTQRNKSDKETIIDMEPVKEQQKISFFKINNFILPLISVLFFVLISTWLILDYLPNFFQKHTNRIKRTKIEKIVMFFYFVSFVIFLFGLQINYFFPDISTLISCMHIMLL